MELGWIDGALLGVLALSLVVGALRGLVFELLAIAGWVVAYFAAVWGGPLLAPHLPLGLTGSELDHGLSYVLVFVLAMIVWGLLARLVRGLVRATPLAPIDRLLGAIFGAVRGAIVLIAFAALIALTPVVKAPAWQSSMVAGWLAHGWQALKPLLPADWAKALPA